MVIKYYHLVWGGFHFSFYVYSRDLEIGLQIHFLVTSNQFYWPCKTDWEAFLHFPFSGNLCEIGVISSTDI